MRAEIERPGMGPEALRTLMARMRPEDLGLTAAPGKTSDPVMERFQLKVLTEGFRNTNFRHHLRAMDRARSAAPRATAYVAGPLRSAAKTEADERNDLRQPESAGTRSRRLAGRCRFRRLLQLVESAKTARSRTVFVPGLV